MKRNVGRSAALFAAAVLVFAACGDDDGGEVREIEDDGSVSGSASGSGSGSGSGSASSDASASASGVEAECVPFGDAEGADTTIDVVLREFEIELAQSDAPAGTVHFAITNEGAEPHEFAVIAGVAPEDIPIAEDGGLDDAALPEGALIGEVEPFPGGETCDGTFELAAGDYTILCAIVEVEAGGEHEAHIAEGMITTFTVTG